MKTCKKCIHYRAGQNLCYEVMGLIEGDKFEIDHYCKIWASECNSYMELTNFIKNVLEEHPEIIRRVQYNEDL